MVFELKLKSCMLNLVGSAILAFGLYNIHSLSGVTEGGVLGLTLLLEHWVNISPAISGFFLNIICYTLGWKSLGRSFIGYSLFAGGGFSLFYAIFEKFPPLFPQIADFPIIASVFGAVFVGVGVGIAVRAGGAPSGDDALAMSLSHILKADIKYIYLISDILVLALSLTYIPLTKILYSVVTVVLSGQIISIISSFRSPKKYVSRPEDWTARDVLVGTLRSVSQLEICIRNKFYHIPATRLSSSDFPVKYIAIYQSKHKFGSDAGIRYYGEVESCKLLPRYEIREIPNDSTVMYYRFDIKEWKKLKTPIAARESDFINMLTTRFLIENSREVPELFLRSAEERQLYLNILDRINGESFVRETEYHGAKFLFDRGRIAVTLNGAELANVTFDEYSRRPLTTLYRILTAIEHST